MGGTRHFKVELKHFEIMVEEGGQVFFYISKRYFIEKGLLRVNKA
jgi:hypothetical protein